MPTGTAIKPSPKKLPLTPDNSADTKPKERNKGGRPTNASKAALLQDESQAFESIKQKWNYISHKLADEASKAARNSKKIDGRSLVALTTAAGIAYDKRWSKQVSDSQDIDIPASLASQIFSKLSKPLVEKESPCMTQGKPCTEEEAASETTEPAPDPMLLSPGL